MNDLEQIQKPVGADRNYRLIMEQRKALAETAITQTPQSLGDELADLIQAETGDQT